MIRLLQRVTFWYPGVGEIIGGSQREERYDVLEARIKETE